MYAVYIVRCADRTLYTGLAADLRRRLTEHNSSRRGAKYTRTRRPVSLVYAKKYRTHARAARAEARIKALSRMEKLALVKQRN